MRQLVHRCVLASCLVVLSGCVGVSRPIKAQVAPGSTPTPARVSAGVDDYMSSDYFTLVYVTFENPTATWLGVERVELLPEPGVAAPTVVAAEDLVAWGSAMERIVRIRAANEALALASADLVFAGVAAVGAGLDSRETVLAGAAGIAGTAVAATSFGMARVVRYGDQTLLLPQSHLLAGAFRVPPGLHADRWILLNAQVRPQVLRLKVTWTDGTQAVLAFDLVPERQTTKSR